MGRHRLTVLSTRELEILQHIAEGEKERTVAEGLCLSLNTVKVHMRSVFRKLEARNAPHAVLIGLRRGLLQ